MLDSEFISEVKRATDIVELASRYTDLKKVGNGIYAGICPNPDHRDSVPSFTVFEKDQSWCCYGCHQGSKHKGKTHSDTIYGTDCFSLVQWASGGKIGWHDSVMKLAKENNISMPTEKNASMYRRNLNLARAYTANLSGEALKYIESRGITQQDARLWMIGFDGLKIVFPLMDKYKKVVGFSRRWLNMPDGQGDKYRNSKNSEIFNKSNYFYGIHLMDESFDKVFITEGCTDVILGNKYGLKNVFATLGTSFTSSHASIIKRMRKTPVFIMDGDKAGIAAARKAIDLLHSVGVRSKIVSLPPGMDMADMSNLMKNDFLNYVEKNMVSYELHLIKEILDEYNSKSMDLKVKLIDEVEEVIKNSSDQDKLIIRSFVNDFQK